MPSYRRASEKACKMSGQLPKYFGKFTGLKHNIVLYYENPDIEKSFLKRKFVTNMSNKVHCYHEKQVCCHHKKQSL